MVKHYWRLSSWDKTRELFFLNPYPQQITLTGKSIDINKPLRISASADLSALEEYLREEFRKLGFDVRGKDESGTLPVILDIRDSGLKKEGYILDIKDGSISLTGQDTAGLFYGMQTLLQLSGFCEGIIPELNIRDWPLYAIRSVMIDMGRAVYPPELIKRIIRIMARLKLNMLHLHLYDDNLMGIRFKNLPLGSENPCALSLSQLADIINYASAYHVSICPELESWGHVGSVVYHYPECYGVPGMWEGKSFGIGNKTFSLLEKIYDEIIPLLPSESFVHLGLDEAKWAMLPGEKVSGDENPEWLVGRLYDILMKTAGTHNRKIQPVIWADHGGRPIPKRLQGKIIIEPWAYFESMEDDIKAKVQRFSAEKGTPFIMGGGCSDKHFAGSFGATRVWCQEAQNSENCLGLNICLWENNMIERHMISLYGGAGCAWNVAAEELPQNNDKYRERVYGMKYRRMLSWQTLFDDALENNVVAARGEVVMQGYYITGSNAGQPVAPTAPLVENNPATSNSTEAKI